MKNLDKFLTFEWDEKNELLEIHGNVVGLEDLVKSILKSIDANGNDHVHMMSADWGGDELSNELMNANNRIINHVKIMKWEKI